MKNRNEIWQAIELAIRADKKNNTAWPDHPAAQAGKVCGQSGRLMNVCLDIKYHKSSSEMILEVQQQYIKEEAIKTAAMAIRFLENLK